MPKIFFLSFCCLGIFPLFAGFFSVLAGCLQAFSIFSRFIRAPALLTIFFSKRAQNVCSKILLRYRSGLRDSRQCSFLFSSFPCKEKLSDEIKLDVINLFYDVNMLNSIHRFQGFFTRSFVRSAKIKWKEKSEFFRVFVNHLLICFRARDVTVRVCRIGLSSQKVCVCHLLSFCRLVRPSEYFYFPLLRLRYNFMCFRRTGCILAKARFSGWKCEPLLCETLSHKAPDVYF